MGQERKYLKEQGKFEDGVRVEGKRNDDDEALEVLWVLLDGHERGTKRQHEPLTPKL